MWSGRSVTTFKKNLVPTALESICSYRVWPGCLILQGMLGVL